MTSFTGTLEESDRGGGRWIALPFDPVEVFGAARAPIKGTVNGTALRSRVAFYGGKGYLGLTRKVRAAAGIGVGDRVDVVLERDDDPRSIDLPDALAVALAGDPVAGAAFAGLAFSHRREYARWIAEAKRDDTRARRAARAVVMLRDGTKHP